RVDVRLEHAHRSPAVLARWPGYAPTVLADQHAGRHSRVQSDRLQRVDGGVHAVVLDQEQRSLAGDIQARVDGNGLVLGTDADQPRGAALGDEREQRLLMSIGDSQYVGNTLTLELLEQQGSRNRLRHGYGSGRRRG